MIEFDLITGRDLLLNLSSPTITLVLFAFCDIGRKVLLFYFFWFYYTLPFLIDAWLRADLDFE